MILIHVKNRSSSFFTPEYWKTLMGIEKEAVTKETTTSYLVDNSGGNLTLQRCSFEGVALAGVKKTVVTAYAVSAVIDTESPVIQKEKDKVFSYTPDSWIKTSVAGLPKRMPISKSYFQDGKAYFYFDSVKATVNWSVAKLKSGSTQATVPGFYRSWSPTTLANMVRGLANNGYFALTSGSLTGSYTKTVNINESGVIGTLKVKFSVCGTCD